MLDSQKIQNGRKDNCITIPWDRGALIIILTIGKKKLIWSQQIDMYENRLDSGGLNCFISCKLKYMFFYLFKVQSHFLKILEYLCFRIRIKIIGHFFLKTILEIKLHEQSDFIFSSYLYFTKTQLSFFPPLWDNCKVSVSPFFFSTALIFTLEPYISFLFFHFSPLYSQTDQ